VAAPLPDGTSCEDGQFCTTGDTCNAGTCRSGSARDCSSATDQCNTGICDEAGDRCRGQPLPDTTTCNDGAWCTLTDHCTAGVCGGTMRDCSAATTTCNIGTCNEATHACFPAPVPDGTVCDADGNPATRDICLAGACRFSTCGDHYWDTVGGECCDDGNVLTETCRTPPSGACVRDCSIRQDTCGNGTLDAATCEACDDGNTDSMDACSTSCTVNDHGVGAPCTCAGSCPVGNPAGGTITGCSGVVVPTGALLACFHSGTVGGGNLYFAGGFCSAYAALCSPSLLCSFAGIPRTVGNYAAFVGPCPAGSVFVQQTITSSGVTLQTKSCQKVCDSDSDCRWNEYDSHFGQCGHYECTASPSTPGTRVCFDAQMSAP
jgi:cysteine-rich repeat protein